ncbi:MAG: threonine/serine dehydratase [Alphaproteobacteria bacterium]|nr:threonine/serine dehydratase [Alphaproteobacteria bacterium]
MTPDELTHDNIRLVAERLRGHIRHTPALEVAGADFGLHDMRLLFKLEYLQHGGSFKARGAFTHMLTRHVPAAGVVAASGGNHGVAVAFAAMRLGVRATIFVPSVCSPAKLDQIKRYGADVRIAGDRYADALAASQAWQADSDALAIHAFDQVETLLGQATVALELEAQAPELDAVLVAVGGGGLIGGMAAWYQSRTPLIGVEPEDAPTLTLALQAGHPVDAPAGGVAADSLAPNQVGALMFPLARKHIEKTVLVSDDAIKHAQQTLWQVLRVVVEPGGAAAFAALQSGRFAVGPGSRIGVLLCGANTDAVRFSA